MTAPTDGTTICEFFKYMPSTPSLPRRLTAIDVSGTTPPASAPTGALRGASKDRTSVSTPNAASWDQFGDPRESFGGSHRIGRSSASGGRGYCSFKVLFLSWVLTGFATVRTTGSSNLLEGAMMAYGKPKRNKGKRPSQPRRARAGATPSRQCAGDKNFEEAFPPSPNSAHAEKSQGGGETEDFSYTRVDPISGKAVAYEGTRPKTHHGSRTGHHETTDQNGTKRHSTLKVRPDGLGRPETLSQGLPVSRPPSSTCGDNGINKMDQNDSLFLSVTDGGSILKYDANVAVEPVDQTSTWVSEGDKASEVFSKENNQQQQDLQTRREEIDRGLDGNSRMLIADIISSFE